jgi:hypothetical protein
MRNPYNASIINNLVTKAPLTLTRLGGKVYTTTKLSNTRGPNARDIPP